MTTHAHPHHRRTRPGLVTRALAAIGAAALAAGGGLTAIEAAHASEASVNDVTLEWRINDEVGGGAYYGGCNFLMAGEASDLGSSHVWSAAEGAAHYRASEGNVTITKPDATGAQAAPTWQSKCLDAAGSSVTTAPGSTSGNRVNLAGGTGTIDPATGTGTISWSGAFTIVFYGGMTYWTVSDPVLTLADGAGTLTARASGFGADMNDPSKWQRLEPTQIELATFTNATLTESGATLHPDYLGVAVDADGGMSPQLRDGAEWGAFPQSFIDFNVRTGQSSYWYSSGGLADPKKPAAPITLAYELTDGPTATLDHARVPAGHSTGIEARFAGLEAASGTVELRTADGARLPVLSPALVVAGAASGRWDVSSLARGTHTLTAVVVDGDRETVVRLTTPLTIDVVAPLSDAAPAELRLTPTATSIAAQWSWPAGDAAGPPSDYRVRVFEGGAAVGTPVVELTTAGTAITLTGLAPDRDYTVEVAPRLAGAHGTPVAASTRTTAGDDGGGDDTGGPGTPGDDSPSGPDDSASSGATLYWGLNAESSGAAYFGGCNFLAAGRAGDKGSSTPWSQGDGLYASASGNVTIVKPVGSSFEQASWATKCTDRTGAAVAIARQGSSTESLVRITNGQVTRADDGTLRIQWRGAFTVAFYGGMSYWSASDPLLVVDADGTGRLTATASGYGASMHDASSWVSLRERTITLATLSGLTAASVERDGGFTLTPDYLGVAYTGTGAAQDVVGGGVETATQQAPRTALNAAHWGAFPSDFIDFQNETGQFSYWFTSNGARDAYKPATPMTVSLDGTGAPSVGTYSAGAAPTTSGRGQTGAVPGGSGSVGAGAGTTADAGATDAAGASSAAAGADGAEAEAGSPLRGPLHPALLAGGGAGVLAVAGVNWSIGLLIRRRLGLDPGAFG